MSNERYLEDTVNCQSLLFYILKKHFFKKIRSFMNEL